MRRDLLRPRALARHALVTAVVVSCVALGQWQLQRLAEVQASNALLQARLQDEATDLDATVARFGDTSEQLDALEFRRVVLTGVFRPDEEVLQRNREHRGSSGFHILTPFETTSGTVILIRRGWVPPNLDDPPVADAPPPPGTVTIHAVLEKPVPQPSFGPQDPDDGVLARVFHTDTARLDRQVTGDLFPMVARMTSDEQPIAGALPLPLGMPELDEANHRSYAVQWHIFAVLAAIGYGSWLVHQTRLRQR